MSSKTNKGLGFLLPGDITVSSCTAAYNRSEASGDEGDGGNEAKKIFHYSNLLEY